MLQKLGFSYRFISLESLKRVGWLRMPYLLSKALAESLGIVREFNPHALVGVGGFASGPVTLAGKILGKPVFVQEQNTLPGTTNRIVARFARKIFTSYPGSDTHFPARRTVLAGNPVRAELRGGEKNYARFGFTKGRFTILVFGGSQGARKINQAMIEAAGGLAEIKDRLQIIHITGPSDQGSVCYDQIQHYVTDFLMEINDAYAIADLVICRAGATTLAEITALGKASILIPYPHASGDHQTKNADFLVRAGAAVKIADSDLDANKLARLIHQYLDHPDRIKEMEEKSRELGSFDGAQNIVCSIRKELADSRICSHDVRR